MIQIETHERTTNINSKNENNESIEKLNFKPDIYYLIPSFVKKSYKTKTNIILTVCIFIIFILSIAIDAIIRHNQMNYVILLLTKYFKSNRSDESIFFYYNQTDTFCTAIGNENLSYISHSFALFIVIVSMFITWRKSFCINFCFARPGLPLLMSPFRKHDRFSSALVYGLIASNIINMIFSLIADPYYKGVFSSVDTTSDPTGLAILLLQIINICIISLRYYPLLICFYSKSFIIYVLSAIYLFVDFIIEIYSKSTCTKLDVVKYFYEDYNDTTTISGMTKEIEKNEKFQIGFDVINLLPSFYLHAHILVILIYKLSIYFNNNHTKDKLMNEDLRFYSKSDIKYCIQLLKNKTKNNGSCKESFFNRYIYKWNDNFKFSSRVINAHVVAFLALFYFLAIWLYYGFLLLSFLEKVYIFILSLIFFYL